MTAPFDPITFLTRRRLAAGAPPAAPQAPVRSTGPGPTAEFLWGMTPQPSDATRVAPGFQRGLRPAPYPTIAPLREGETVEGRTPSRVENVMGGLGALVGTKLPMQSQKAYDAYRRGRYMDAATEFSRGLPSAIPAVALGQTIVEGADAASKGQGGRAGLMSAMAMLPMVGKLAKPAARAANEELRSVLNGYRAEQGIVDDLPRVTKVDPDAAEYMARIYQGLPASEEEARAAYAQLDVELRQQEAALRRAGYEPEFVSEDPYKDSAEMMADVAKRKRIRTFKTPEDSFHPFMTPEQNDRLRWVHDLLGHATEGNQFGAIGEENAYRAHYSTFSPLARRALATETRGQNSWVNFGPYASLPVRDRPFAEQKAALFPEELTGDYDAVHAAREAALPPLKLPLRGERGRPSRAAQDFSDELSSILDENGKHPLGAKVEYDLTGDNVVRIKTLEAPEAGTGAGRRAMRQIGQLADKHGVALELNASPFGENAMDPEALRNYYRRHGFRNPGGRDASYMTRAPQEPLTAPELRASQASKAEAQAAPAGLLGGDAPIEAPMLQTSKTSTGLFDLSQLGQAPQALADVPQVPLPRGAGPATLPAYDNVISQVLERFNGPKVRDAVARGVKEGAAPWYDTDLLYRAAMEELGPEAGKARIDQLMNFMGATSKGMAVPRNLKLASEWSRRAAQGELPSVAELRAGGFPIRPGYGHMYQGDVNQVLADIMENGLPDSVKNPKVASFAANLRGNMSPFTADRHAIRMAGLPEIFGNPKLAAPPKMYYEGIEDAARDAATNLQQAGILPVAPGRDPAAAFQAAMWVGGAEETGVRSGNEPFMGLLGRAIERTAEARGERPVQTLKAFLRGETALAEPKVTLPKRQRAPRKKK